MLELQQRKKALAAGIYEASGRAAAALDAADIERLFQPVGVTYSPATAKRPTLGTVSIGRSGRIQ